LPTQIQECRARGDRSESYKRLKVYISLYVKKFVSYGNVVSKTWRFDGNCTIFQDGRGPSKYVYLVTEDQEKVRDQV
jgi:hypothetical protein